MNHRRIKHLAHDHIKLSVVFFCFVALFCVTIVRLFVVQISHYDFFKKKAQQQYETTILRQQPRAEIYDRNNMQLALNKQVMSAFILPHQIYEGSRTHAFLKKHFRKTWETMQKYPNKKFLWVTRNPNAKTRQLLAEHATDDIHLAPETKRFYPLPSATHVLGITDIDNNGLSGVELCMNRELAGVPATFKIHKDARSSNLHFSQEVIDAGIPGSKQQLTIDSTLQFFTAQEVQKTVKEFEAEAGSAIVMEPTSGEVLAMVNYPYQDPNDESANMQSENNNAICTCYEFGSVFKVFAALAALDENITTSDELFDCEGKVTYLDRFRLENWKHLGVLPFSDVVRYSSNVGIAKVAKRLGPKLYNNLRTLGFGTKTGVNLPGERSGFVNPPTRWSKSSPFVLSFGYEVNATLLQLARAFSIISNGGYDVIPRINLTEHHTRGKQLYKTQTIEILKKILEPIGAHHNVASYRVMGKTGTARIAQKGGYSRKDHIYSFGGIVENGNYKRVIVTYILRPKKTHLWASQVSGPLFQKIARKMTLYERFKGKTA